MLVATVNASTQLSDADLAFWVEGINASLKECCEAYGVPFTPVALFRSVDGLPTTDVRVATYVDDIPEAPGAAAYHTVGDDGRPLSKMRADSGSVGGDHEAKEEAIDPECIGAATDSQGRVWDKEVCDPCQGDTRKVSVTIMGETRDVEVSDFVLPAFWDKDSITGPWDAFGLMTGPFQIRPQGYAVIDGNEVFAEGDTVAAAAVATKKADPGSRLNRRLARAA